MPCVPRYYSWGAVGSCGPFHLCCHLCFWTCSLLPSRKHPSRLSVYFCFSLFLYISLSPTVVTIGRDPWKVSEQTMKRFRGTRKILEDAELVGNTLALHWVRKWMLVFASSNDSLFFLSWPDGTELLPTQGEHGDKRMFTGRHLRQKKEKEKGGWRRSLF